MDESPRDELLRMHEADQAQRREAMQIAGKHGRSSPEYQAFRGPAVEAERRRTARLVEILERDGWPGTSRVGEAASRAAFLLLQHADLETQERFLPVVREATARGELPPQDLPLLEDRVLVLRGRKQVYGTQISRSRDGTAEPFPIEDGEHVDERRARVGLEPLSDYLRRFGVVRTRPDAPAP